MSILEVCGRTISQLVEKPNRNLVRALRIGQRQQHWIIGGLSSQCAVNLVQPFRQLVVTIISAQRAVIGDVVAPPHKGVHRAQGITLPPWKYDKRVVKVFCGGAGDAPADGVRHIELRSSRRELHWRISHGGAQRCFSCGFPNIFPSAARATRASFRAFEMAGRLPSTA